MPYGLDRDFVSITMLDDTPLAPKGVPPAIVAKLHAEVAKTLQQSDVKKRFTEVGGMSSAEFAERIRQDVARYTDVVRKANIRVE